MQKKLYHEALVIFCSDFLRWRKAISIERKVKIFDCSCSFGICYVIKMWKKSNQTQQSLFNQKSDYYIPSLYFKYTYNIFLCFQNEDDDKKPSRRSSVKDVSRTNPKVNVEQLFSTSHNVSQIFLYQLKFRLQIPCTR